MKIFSIWMEGYSATGNESSARFIGSAEGDTFEQAVQSYAKKHPEEKIEYSDSYGWNIWGCRLFSNEYDARRGFG